MKELVLKENSRSVAGRQLPPIHCDGNSGAILLFYQYKEPEWTHKQHKDMLRKVIELGEKLKITGRGRVAPEGLNCTLSGTAQSIRNFCKELREIDPVFNETDFKITDNVSTDKLFKSLSIRKTKELVAYGLAGEKAPSLKEFAGEHLEADEYHRAMMEKDTVIIDVRNRYESALGNFQPPSGGAELIDPQMRNSIEFPKWLNDPATQKKLNGKKVLMYCTGGIRCERATALLNQMSAVKPDELKPKAVYELRGGIERYMKTFPQGGFWKGKNYLFDRRMEQLSEDKSKATVEAETNSRCCLCLQKWTIYRGKFKCSQGLCGVPVIVCDSCRQPALGNPNSLTCELCKVGYKAPKLMPDLVSLKRKAESQLVKNGKEKTSEHKKISAPISPTNETLCDDRLFISRLPLIVTKTKLSELLGGDIKIVHWIRDRKSGAFYGSCIVQMNSTYLAKQAVERSIKVNKKKVKVSFAKDQGDMWPPDDYQEREFPPIGY
mmetsp:Transcript_11620/g.17875  ORF Transcript_11620/g.17875 Transcript_11620/m.17875 type:complete len:493 (+) Transcript_11620:165-1643(+)|eukprot:CAMPEP_0178913880 /NCGR_PEP_ID=MMETSP0786-20121207/11095_1 /TAXON_ID=186022 /ORGANISM="Thalassionema frauenfeldii, Strain CCMP 1798" /LENGTH=492 /DNA_ID=CAMNT_0020586685 /DNA_START=92 /DNA_END=1570 /DNA_ORIENTATION=+